MQPPRHRTLVAVSAPAEEKTHSNAQGDHEVRALQQPPNAAHAKRAISKQARPSLYEVRTPQGSGLHPARREVPATGLTTGP